MSRAEPTEEEQCIGSCEAKRSDQSSCSIKFPTSTVVCLASQGEQYIFEGVRTPGCTSCVLHVNDLGGELCRDQRIYSS